MANPKELVKSKLDNFSHSNDCYLGLAVTGRDQGEFILIAKDTATLKRFWNRFMSIELDVTKSIPVAVVGIKDG